MDVLANSAATGLWDVNGGRQIDCWGVRESDGGFGDVDFYSRVGVGWETHFEVEKEVGVCPVGSGGWRRRWESELEF